MVWYGCGYVGCVVVVIGLLVVCWMCCCVVNGCVCSFGLVCVLFF